MEMVSIAKAIDDRVEALENMKKSLVKLGNAHAEAVANYDRKVALTIVRLRSDESIEFESNEISKPPVSIVEKLAKGICWQECLEMEKSSAMWKALNSNIQVTMAQINALQSLFKNLGEL